MFKVLSIIFVTIFLTYNANSSEKLHPEIKFKHQKSIERTVEQMNRIGSYKNAILASKNNLTITEYKMLLAFYKEIGVDVKKTMPRCKAVNSKIQCGNLSVAILDDETILINDQLKYVFSDSSNVLKIAQELNFLLKIKKSDSTSTSLLLNILLKKANANQITIDSVGLMTLSNASALIRNNLQYGGSNYPPIKVTCDSKTNKIKICIQGYNDSNIIGYSGTREVCNNDENQKVSAAFNKAIFSRIDGSDLNVAGRSPNACGPLKPEELSNVSCDKKDLITAKLRYHVQFAPNTEVQKFATELASTVQISRSVARSAAATSTRDTADKEVRDAEAALGIQN